MSDMSSFTAFQGDRRVASGSALEVALAVRAAEQASPHTVLIFDDGTGRAVDFDLRGSSDDIAARFCEGPRLPGRPKLGVVAREITLLPRHWEWLAAQRGGPSATLRRLVDAARAADPAASERRRAKEAADGFMGAVLGDQPGYEEASRSLYGGDRDRFWSLSETWPVDLRDHARRLAAEAFAAPS